MSEQSPVVERGGSGCFRAILLAAGVMLVLVCGAAIYIYLTVAPHIPRYASPVSESADVGARRFAVPYCDPDPEDCVGYLRFYRAGDLLLYQDGEGLIAINPATGALLWETSGDFNRPLHPPHLIEFKDREYAYAELSGQVVDLDDGRVAFEQGNFAGAWYGEGRHDPRRVRGGLYRLPLSDVTLIVDLQTSEIAPYAGPSDAPPTPPADPMAPGWHGPIDQTDDGAYALWFRVGEQNAVVLFSRARQREVWRASVIDAPLAGWIDAAQNHVVAVTRTGPRVAFDLTTGRPIPAPPEPDYVSRTTPAHRAIEIIYEREKGLPEEWRNLEVAATEDLSVVAHYQMRRPPNGFRTRGSYFTEGGTEGGERRLRVTAGPGGPVLLEREMEIGRTTTAGYDIAIALSPDGSRVAILPTDGVVRIYDVPRPS